MTDAITREEKLMKAMATGSPSNIKPITREEMFLAKAGGQGVETPEPITRREKLLQGIIDNGVAGGSKPEGTISITENGLFDVTEYASADVMVPIDGGYYNARLKNDGVSVDNYMCKDYSNLAEVNLPHVTSIGSSAFLRCSQLKFANFPLVTTLGGMSFGNCTALMSANFPLVKGLNSNTFQQCTALTDINFPYATFINSNCFYGCTALEEVIFPLVKSVQNGVFDGCTALEEVIFPVLKSITSGVFQNCTNLKVVVLGNETVCTLSNVNAFNNTPFAIGGTGGEAYVPQALIEQYKIATNWSTLYEAGTCNFVAIEGSEYE